MEQYHHLAVAGITRRHPNSTLNLGANEHVENKSLHAVLMISELTAKSNASAVGNGSSESVFPITYHIRFPLRENTAL